MRPSLHSATGPSRSSNAPLTRPGFSCSRGDGSSNEPSPDSIETAASPKISRLRSPAPKPGYTSPPCRCSLGDWPDNNTIYTIKIRTLSASDAGNEVTRAFCPECCCPLFIRVSARPDIVGLRVGSLDDPSGFRPEADIFAESAQPWDHMNPDVPKHQTYPPGRAYTPPD